MPSWEGRLSPLDRKILALYLFDLRGANDERRRRSDEAIRTKPLLWAAIGAGLLLVLIANAHLVYMAVMSQPECVAHVRQGEGVREQGKFSAARSSCTPR